jgi:hypothetical protein
VLAGVPCIAVHVDAILLGVDAEEAGVESEAAAREAAVALVDVVLELEAGGDLGEGAPALLDADLVHLVARAFLDVAELGLPGLRPEFLLHDEGARRRVLAL